MDTIRRRLLGALLGAGMVMALASGVAQAAPTEPDSDFEMIPLPVPEGTANSAVSGGDPTGRFLVGSVYLPDEDMAVGLVWRNGRFTRIDASSVQHVGINYDDVNRHGVVIGERTTDTSSFHRDAFRWRNGRFTMLPAPNPSDETDAVAINSRGDIVGNSWSSGAWRIVVWPADQPGTVRVLTMPDGQPAQGLASDIDEDGTVVGTLAPYPPGTPYVWPANGTPHALPIPEGSVGGDAMAIRLGMVAGDVFIPDPSDPSTQFTRPTLWNLVTGGTTTHHDVAAGVLSVNRWGTIGMNGSIVHPDGRVVPMGDTASVEVVTDRGAAAGMTDLFNGQAVRWVPTAR